MNAVGIGVQRCKHANRPMVHTSDPDFGTGSPTLIPLVASFPVDVPARMPTLFPCAAPASASGPIVEWTAVTERIAIGAAVATLHAGEVSDGGLAGCLVPSDHARASGARWWLGPESMVHRRGCPYSPAMDRDDEPRIAARHARDDAALEDGEEGLWQFAEPHGADAIVSCRFETHFDSRTISVAGFGTPVRRPWRRTRQPAGNERLLADELDDRGDVASGQRAVLGARVCRRHQMHHPRLEKIAGHADLDHPLDALVDDVARDLHAGTERQAMGAGAGDQRMVAARGRPARQPQLLSGPDHEALEGRSVENDDAAIVGLDPALRGKRPQDRAGHVAGHVRGIGEFRLGDRDARLPCGIRALIRRPAEAQDRGGKTPVRLADQQVGRDHGGDVAIDRKSVV